jgi:hypothetical protein
MRSAILSVFLFLLFSIGFQAAEASDILPNCDFQNIKFDRIGVDEGAQVASQIKACFTEEGIQAMSRNNFLALYHGVRILSAEPYSLFPVGTTTEFTAHCPSASWSCRDGDDHYLTITIKELTAQYDDEFGTPLFYRDCSIDRDGEISGCRSLHWRHE